MRSNLGVVNGVASIMAWPVLDILDQVFGFAKGTDDQFNNLNVGLFIITTYIIDLAIVSVKLCSQFPSGFEMV